MRYRQLVPGAVVVIEGIPPTPTPLTTDFVRDELACAGTEPTLASCGFDNSGIGTCVHANDDVGVSCQITPVSNPSCAVPPEPPFLVNGSIRLTNGSVFGNAVRGNLEIFYMGQWTSVCDDRFEIADANKACQTLGFGPSGKYYVFVAVGGKAQVPSLFINCFCLFPFVRSFAQF